MLELVKNYDTWNCSIFHHDDIRERILEDGIHVYENNGQKIDVYIKGLNGVLDFSVEERFCLIVMSGAVSDRENKEAPLFSGLELAKRCNLPIVAISDPTLDLDKTLNLSWYAGNIHQTDLQKKIVNIVESIVSTYKLKPIIVGGSGGGFAATQLAMGAAMQSVALVWNPQTDITKYVRPFVEKYIRSAFNADLDLSNGSDEAKALFENLNINYKLMESPANCSTKVLYLQNKSDCKRR